MNLSYEKIRDLRDVTRNFEGQGRLTQNLILTKVLISGKRDVASCAPESSLQSVEDKKNTDLLVLLLLVFCLFMTVIICTKTCDVFSNSFF